MARVRLFILRAALLGITARRALFRELPGLVFWRAYNRFASIVYAFVDQQRLADQRTKAALLQPAESGSPDFYVIVVPQVIHLLIPAVRLVSPYVKVVFVLNGVSTLEEQALRSEVPEIPTIRLWTLPKASWPHGRVLSLLLRTSPRDFGILDHDFFLFDHRVIRQLEFRDNEFAICATTWRNQRTGLVFPGTHLLYLRADLLRAVMKKHGVGAQLYKHVPRNVKPILEGMRLSMGNPPKEYQSFFDSFLMLSALAISEGLEVRQLDLAPDNWEHIGGTSMGRPMSKGALHHYVSARFLDLLSEGEMAGAYRRMRIASPDRAETLRKLVDPSLAARVDALIDRIARLSG